MQNRVYGKTADHTSSNGTKKQRDEGVPANVPEDPLFVRLYAGRRVSYLPQIAEALRQSGAPKRLLDRYTEAATLLASDLIYWTPKSRADGWIYKSRIEVWEETGLPERRQRRARELLREAGVLEEKAQGFRLYYRIRWGTLKPLLRLAAENFEDHSGSHGDANLSGNSASHGDANYSGSHGDAERLDRMATQRSGSHGDPTSVSYSGWDRQTGQDQSSTRASEAGDSDDSYSGNRGTIDDGWNDSPGSKLTPDEEATGRIVPGTTSSQEGDAPGEIGGEGCSSERSGARADSSPEPARSSLMEQIRYEMESIAPKEIPGGAKALAEALAGALGREQPDAGIVRVAGYAASHDVPELLGEVAARAGSVRHPLPFYAKSLAQAIKDEEAAPRELRQGSASERFEAAYTASRHDDNHRSGDGRASSDPEGRPSLTGRNMTPIYGVRNPKRELNATMAFRKGGSAGKKQDQ